MSVHSNHEDVSSDLQAPAGQLRLGFWNGVHLHEQLLEGLGVLLTTHINVLRQVLINSAITHR